MPDNAQPVIVLGAGASRGVSYAFSAESESPLDSDFFDLLQRTSGSKWVSVKKARTDVLKRMEGLSRDYWRSMERAFYTLHLERYVAEKLGAGVGDDSTAKVVSDFAVCIQNLLRLAHGKRICEHHKALLGSARTIITFNYDLVAERAIQEAFTSRSIALNQALYGLTTATRVTQTLLLKLHGSSNWSLHNGNMSVRQKQWADLKATPGYMGDRGEGTTFPIFLPFWDKRIENKPWLGIWKKAFTRLSQATELVVWGYSMPLTDIKAQSLFTLALRNSEELKLAVIDPSETARQRWRDAFPKAQYWHYPAIKRFLANPPKWWRP